jgi:hypothetical protein
MRDPLARLAPGRCHALDGARLLAILLLFPYHTTAIFYTGSLGESYVSDPNSSPAMCAFVVLVHKWHMPLFFFLAGAASWHSLQVCNAVQFLQERLQRLLLPLVVGVFLLVPPHVYLHLRQSINIPHTYLQFYPQFFDGIRPAGNIEWAHLWFLAYLLVISVACLPLMLRLNHQRETTAPWDFFRSGEGLGFLLLLALPLMLSESQLRPHWPGFQNLYDDWANLMLYLIYFFYGFLFYHQPSLWRALDQHRWTCLGLACLGMMVFMAITSSGVGPFEVDSAASMLFHAFRGLNGWCAVLALLGLARRFIVNPHPVMDRATRIAMPLYLLHQPLLVGLGWFVIHLPLAIAAKFTLLCGGSLMVTVGLIESVVRRLGPLAPCFGLVSRR